MILWDYAPRSTLCRLGVALQFNMDVIEYLSSKQAQQSLEFDFLNPFLRSYALDFLGVPYQPFLSDVMTISDNSVIRIALGRFGIRSVEILDDYPNSKASWSEPGKRYILENFGQAHRKFKINLFVRK
jgi:hypothetical protein